MLLIHLLLYPLAVQDYKYTSLSKNRYTYKLFNCVIQYVCLVYMVAFNGLHLR